MAAKAKRNEPLTGRFGDATDDWADAEPLTTSMGERVRFSKGTVVIGTYVGDEQVTVDSDSGEGKESIRYIIMEDSTGNRINFSPSYQLREAFENVELGDLLRIECMGEQATKRGLNAVKLFTVKRKAKA